MSAANAQGWHPESRFTVVDGVRCHYLDLGPRGAPPLVLIHGIAVSSWNWRHNLARLSRRRRLIVPCHKGFGWSGRDRGDYSVRGLARFVLGLLDQLGVERADFAGNSLGGAVSTWIATHRPARARRVVLINPAVLKSQRPWKLLHTQIPALGPVYKRLVTPTVMRAGLAALAYRNLRVDSGYMANFWGPLSVRGSIQTMLAVARQLPGSLEDLDAHVEQMSQPTLAVWGERDGVLPVRGGFELARRVPDCRLVLFERSGHCPHEEEPERFDALVDAWLLDEG